MAVLEGKGIVGLSLPVRIFHSRSTIERVTDLWGYCSYYLNRGLGAKPEEKIRLVLSMIIGSLPMTLNQWKPFNPLLGETYTCTYPDGTRVDCEHTSHHPPVTNYYIKSENYKIYGSFTYNAEIKANKLNAFNEGWGTVEWSDGSKIKFSQPMLQLGGTVIGSRSVISIGSTTAVDESIGMKGVIKMAAEAKTGLSSWFVSSKTDTFKGAIYMYDKTIHKKTCGHKWPKMVREFGDMKDVAQEIEKIEGSWLENLKFGSQVYWDINRDLQHYMEKTITTEPLPSDCRFREDILWLGYNEAPKAQIWKVRLEEQQRWDRANRKKYNESEEKK